MRLNIISIVKRSLLKNCNVNYIIIINYDEYFFSLHIALIFRVQWQIDIICQATDYTYFIYLVVVLIVNLISICFIDFSSIFFLLLSIISTFIFYLDHIEFCESFRIIFFFYFLFTYCWFFDFEY
jgi:hypothetical protein